MDEHTFLNLLWFLAIGFFFYWMMAKGGCGAHGAGHKHGGDQAQHDSHGDTPPTSDHTNAEKH